MKILDSLICPVSHTQLTLFDNSLRNKDNLIFKIHSHSPQVIDFMEPLANSDHDKGNLAAYNNPATVQIYRNFLNWLFKTFEVDESQFRAELVSHLNLAPHQKILIVGVGLGEDIEAILKNVNETCEIHAQDISRAMIIAAAQNPLFKNVHFTISNGNSLPYRTQYFDAVFHFGGINLFGEMKNAIAELARVCKIGGRVVFGDEGIAKHLLHTEYAKILINNISLWSSEAPLHLLPENAAEIQLNYYLGNCFYLLSFTVAEGLPKVNIDIPHLGRRGGTARTRYFGQLEGVSVETKKRLIDKAAELNCSVHELLESMIVDSLKKNDK